MSLSLDKIEELAKTIQHEVSAVQLPRLMATYQAGNTLSFGPFLISRSGISKGDTPLILWEQIKKISIEKGSVQVLAQEGPLPHMQEDTKSVPNIAMFMKIVDDILSSASR